VLRLGRLTQLSFSGTNPRLELLVLGFTRLELGDQTEPLEAQLTKHHGRAQNEAALEAHG
jgi:hypothetical protein